MMARQIINDFLDMMPDTIRVWKHLTTTDSGEESYEAGADTLTGGTPYPCKISGETAVVQGTTTHKLKATLATQDPLKNEDLYVLPDRFDPKVFYGGVQVKPVSDENGPHHVVVYF